MRTTLNLLTRDGAVYMAFEPSLSVPQYARLLDIATRAENGDELENGVKAFARAEGLRVSFDEMESPTE